MENSKLFDLLSSFSAREWRSFNELVRAPFFNRSEEVIRLFDWLEKRITTFEHLDRKSAHQAVFPDTDYQDARLNHTMSALLKLGETFIGLLEYQKEGFLPEFMILKGLSERGLEKHYRYLFERKSQEMERTNRQSALDFLNRYKLENLEAYRLQLQGGQGFNPFVQRTSDSLDNFYLAEKLRCTCFMLTSERLLAVPYRIYLAEEINEYLRQCNPESLSPIVWAYHLVYQLLSKPEAHDEFERLKAALPALESKLSRAEIEEIYQHAINYCNLQIIQAESRYVVEALNLYIWGLDTGILLQNDQLSPWHFKNIIKLALRLAKYEWTEQFIRARTPLLPREFREDAFHFNLAELYYYTKQNDKALENLNKVEFRDVSYHLGAKIMLAKIYFEMDAFDALDSLLHAFGIYLRRNKVISEDIRKTYLNFVAILGKLTRATSTQFPALRSKIETAPLLAARTWLLNQVLG